MLGEEGREGREVRARRGWRTIGRTLTSILREMRSHGRVEPGVIGCGLCFNGISLDAVLLRIDWREGW